MEKAAVKRKEPTVEDLKALIHNVPNFPKPGIMFRDISLLLREQFDEVIRQMADLISEAEWQNIDLIGGIESRGFILAAGLAIAKQKGFVKIRKRGKLPGKVVTHAYGLEYGEDALEMQYGSGRMLIADDVLATGGTLTAAAKLAVQTGHTVSGFCCMINLAYLNQFQWNNIAPHCLIEYQE